MIDAILECEFLWGFIFWVFVVPSIIIGIALGFVFLVCLPFLWNLVKPLLDVLKQ